MECQNCTAGPAAGPLTCKRRDDITFLEKCNPIFMKFSICAKYRYELLRDQGQGSRSFASCTTQLQDVNKSIQVTKVASSQWLCSDSSRIIRHGCVISVWNYCPLRRLYSRRSPGGGLCSVSACSSSYRVFPTYSCALSR